MTSTNKPDAVQEDMSRLLPTTSTCFTLCRGLRKLQTKWSQASASLENHLSTSRGQEILQKEAQTRHGGDLVQAREHMRKILQQQVM